MEHDPESRRVVSYAQDLPPGLLLLSRVANHIQEELRRFAQSAGSGHVLLTREFPLSAAPESRLEAFGYHVCGTGGVY